MGVGEVSGAQRHTRMLNFNDSLVWARTHPGDSHAHEVLAEAALASQNETEALPVIAAAARRSVGNARLWHWTGLLHRALDDRVAAIPAFEAAVRFAPNDARIAHGLARVLLEAGQPAIAAFERARSLSPADGDVVLGLYAAKLAAGEGDEAVRELDGLLALNPAWVAGHNDLLHLRWMMGDQTAFVSSIERSLMALPRHEELWQLLLSTLVRGDRFDEALAAAGRARKALGERPFLIFNEAVIRSEMGSVAAADACFERMADADDMEVAVRHVRHLLRCGRIDAAAKLIERWIDAPDAAPIWPYAAIIWRLAGDARFDWLEGQDGLIGVFDLASELPPLARLADMLRNLHQARFQHFNQSVRGGTQTDGALLSRIEPEIRDLRAAIVAATLSYIAGLPRADPRHPTLSPRRDRIPRFSGSWSVRLQSRGFHANHVHPAGWLSSALYVALPQSMERTDAQAGWLALGEPQAELGLALPAAQLIEPKMGRLVIFPSTMWHGTRPFPDGERLTVAFDVRRPL